MDHERFGNAEFVVDSGFNFLGVNVFTVRSKDQALAPAFDVDKSVPVD
jgi:hypothetical protein